MQAFAFGGGVERRKTMQALARRDARESSSRIGFSGQAQECSAEDFSLRRIGSTVVLGWSLGRHGKCCGTA